MAQSEPRCFVNVLFAADVCSQLELKMKKEEESYLQPPICKLAVANKISALAMQHILFGIFHISHSW